MRLMERVLNLKLKEQESIRQYIEFCLNHRLQPGVLDYQQQYKEWLPALMTIQNSASWEKVGEYLSYMETRPDSIIITHYPDALFVLTIELKQRRWQFAAYLHENNSIELVSLDQ